MEFINPTNVGKEIAREHYVKFLKALGIWDLMGDEPRVRTPTRVVESFCEFFGNNLEPINFTTFPISSKTDQMVFVGDIDFAALCAHHHLPFFGKCHVAYYPDKKVCGLSKIPRAIEHFTHGALIQEDVAEALADYLEKKLDPHGVAVAIEAEHTCMSLRGVKKPGHRTVSIVYRGTFNHEKRADDRNTFVHLWRP